MIACAHCGHESPSHSRYCGGCGRSLVASALPAADTPLPFGCTLDAYQVFEEIGRGGMGVVYRGHDAELDRAVAIKVLPEALARDADVVDRFRREARAMAALHHPNVVPVYAIGRSGALHYFVMKFLVGRTVADLLDARLGTRGPPIEVDEVVDVLVQTCAGLEHAHGHGLIHRDVKPGNIMVGDDGLVTLMDFGIVKEQRPTGRQTHTGLVLGTPEYIAPELARGKGPAGPATDLYALGVVAYEMLTLQAPFGGETPFEIVTRHLNDPPPRASASNPAVPPALDAVLLRCMAKDPADRWGSAAELAAALEGLPGADRRRGQRVPINRAFLSIADFLAQYATDVSLTGCFLRAREPLPVGTRVDLRFSVMGEDLVFIEGQGEVVRVVDQAPQPGMGLRFTRLTDASRLSLRRILEAP